MSISPLAFYTFATLAIAFSLLVIFKKNPVSSAFSLVLVFFSFAGIYATLGAHLIAALQVLVYAGAIMVLFIFVIMLLNADAPSLDMRRSHPIYHGIVIILALLLFVAFVVSFKQSSLETVVKGLYTHEFIESKGGNSKVVAELIFSKYLLPFELTSVLLLAAIIGAVAIAKRKTGKN
jgi:NADH-quinone oxidoreductase subunit J